MPVDKTNVIKGRDLMLFRQVGSGSAAKWEALGAATSHSLSLSTDNSDTSNKDTAQFKTVLPGGNISWTISAECMYRTDDFKELVTDIISGNVYKVCFGVILNPSSTGEKPPEGWQPDPADCWQGNAFLNSVDANAPYEGTATYSAQFTGSGVLAPMQSVSLLGHARGLRVFAETLTNEKEKAETIARAEQLEKVAVRRAELEKRGTCEALHFFNWANTLRFHASRLVGPDREELLDLARRNEEQGKRLVDEYASNFKTVSPAAVQASKPKS